MQLAKCEIASRIAVIRIETENGFIVRGGGGIILRFEQRVCASAESIEIAGRNPQRFVVTTDRVGEVPERNQGRAAIDQGFQNSRLKRQDLVVAVDRLFITPEFRERVSPIVPCFGDRGICSQGGIEAAQCFDLAPRRHQETAAIDQRFGETRSEKNGLVEAGKGFIAAVQTLKRTTVREKCIGGFRIEPRGLLYKAFGLFISRRLEIDEAERIQRIEVPGVGPENLAIQTRGLRKVSALMSSPRALKQRFVHDRITGSSRACSCSFTYAASRLRVNRAVSNRACVPRLRCSFALISASALRSRASCKAVAS